MRMAYIGMIIIFLMMECITITPSHSTMQFAYTCEGKGATATTYSYLREPRLESGMSIGLKSGSFNYLENGDIKLEENINYDYGNGTKISNATDFHALKVDFEGKRGISEFFGIGFFNNNRWISAWKKIRYEESPTMKVNGWNVVSRPSNYINVDASVIMDSSINASSYAFDYDAKIKNGVIETRDAAGWSNRTGAKKYDWESETRTVGNEINITNVLYDSERIKVAAGPIGEWLPCNFCGTIPTVDPLNVKWPTDVTIAALKADTQYPSKKATSKQLVPARLTNQLDSKYTKQLFMIGRIESMPRMRLNASEPSVKFERIYANPHQVIGSNASIVITEDKGFVAETFVNYVDPYYAKKILKVGMVTPFADVKDSTTNTSFLDPPILENESCTPGSCKDYEGIYTYDEDMVGAAASRKAVVLQRGETRNIAVIAYVYEISDNATASFYGTENEAAKEERYNITIVNSGDILLNKIELTVELSKGMMFKNAEYYGSGSGKLTSIPIPLFDENTKTMMTWSIGSMEPNERKSILMNAYLKQKDRSNNKMDVKNTDIKANVVGIDPSNIPVSDSKSRAEPALCNPVDEDGKPCLEWHRKLGICTGLKCPDWCLEKM
jgi:hypothetical protein